MIEPVSNIRELIGEEEYYTRLELADIHQFMGERVKDMHNDDLKVVLVCLSHYYGHLHPIKKDFDFEKSITNTMDKEDVDF